ncbi:MAG: DUF2281 domain-containing protein [Pleurocapsa sp. SU_5_0]|nr:DUF2281 domain-containing protein [Pleurocapsa sp. SU_5_0]NJO98312.1 DUF2281 domain-containing protein [Pleurocapsa sp. CRU_1_2]
MNIEQNVLNKMRQLPIEKQQELLDFAEFLAQKNAIQLKLKTIKGLCDDLTTNLTEEDIAEARKEMWGNFPREII